ncbi:MAG TPA: hypothetical protein VJS44_17000 [Pyrinomonadaceae bacterium]|nr:hypothetical protein [Pyrinomonadaceae bacterium]
MANGYPEGQYTDVYCHPISEPYGSLSKGTGTYTESTKTFSCGAFSANDLPKVGAFYNLNGVYQGKRYEFPGWKCVHAGTTSDFKEK